MKRSARGEAQGRWSEGPLDNGAWRRSRDSAVLQPLLLQCLPTWAAPGRTGTQVVPTTVAGLHGQRGPAVPLGKVAPPPPRVRLVCLPTAMPRTHHPQDDVEAQHGGDPPKGLTLQDGVLRLEAVTRRKVLSLSHHIQVPWRDSHPGRLPGEQRGLQVRYEATPAHYATCRSWGAGAGVH